ncbi:glycosyl transferase family 4, partial [Frankia sp. CNm7]|nr:glycosyl transferase family 4 [Frankia nepalensis]
RRRRRLVVLASVLGAVLVAAVIGIIGPPARAAGRAGRARPPAEDAPTTPA